MLASEMQCVAWLPYPGPAEPVLARAAQAPEYDFALGGAASIDTHTGDGP